jgi:hypothetical protein
MKAQKDLVQDVGSPRCYVQYYGRYRCKLQVQAQISEVIEPAAEKLIPIAGELKEVYRQIELLEVILPSNYVAASILIARADRRLLNAPATTSSR